MWRSCRLEVTPGFFLTLLVSLTGSAGQVLPVVLSAAVCHELGHLAALRLAGAGVERFRLTAFGAELRSDTRYLPYGRELACVLAGPGVNLLFGVLLARLGHYTPAGAHVVLGLFNLLPVSELDGGRALHLLVSWLTEPVTADRVCTWVGAAAALAFTGVCVYLTADSGGGLFLLLTAFGVLLRQIPLVKAAGKR